MFGLLAEEYEIIDIYILFSVRIVHYTSITLDVVYIESYLTCTKCRDLVVF
jgi:hypothetical protein